MALERLREKIVVVLPRTPLLENKKGRGDRKGRENNLTGLEELVSEVKSRSFQFKQFAHMRTRSFERYQQPLRTCFKAKVVMQTKEISESFSSVSVQAYHLKRALVRRPLHMNFRSFVSRDFSSNPLNHSITSSSPRPNRLPSKEYIESLSKQLKPFN